MVEPLGLASLPRAILLRVLECLERESACKVLRLSRAAREDPIIASHILISMGSSQLAALSSLKAGAIRQLEILRSKLESHRGALAVSTEALTRTPRAVSSLEPNLTNIFIPTLLSLGTIREDRFALPDEFSLLFTQEWKRLWDRLRTVYLLAEIFRATGDKLTSFSWTDFTDATAASNLLDQTTRTRHSTQTRHPTQTQSDRHITHSTAQTRHSTARDDLSGHSTPPAPAPLGDESSSVFGDEMIDLSRRILRTPSLQPTRMSLSSPPTVADRPRWRPPGVVSVSRDHSSLLEDIREAAERRRRRQNERHGPVDVATELQLELFRIFTMHAMREIADACNRLVSRSIFSLKSLRLNGLIFRSPIFRSPAQSQTQSAETLSRFRPNRGRRRHESLQNLFCPQLKSLVAPMALIENWRAPKLESVSISNVQSLTAVSKFLLHHKSTLKFLSLQLKDEEQRVYESETCSLFSLRSLHVSIDGFSDQLQALNFLCGFIRAPNLSCLTVARAAPCLERLSSSPRILTEFPELSKLKHLSLPDVPQGIALPTEWQLPCLNTISCPARTFIRLFENRALNAPSLHTFVCTSLRHDSTARLASVLATLPQLETLCLPCDLPEHHAVFHHVKTTCFPGGVNSSYPSVRRHIARFPVALDLILSPEVSQQTHLEPMRKNTHHIYNH